MMVSSLLIRRAARLGSELWPRLREVPALKDGEDIKLPYRRSLPAARKRSMQSAPRVGASRTMTYGRICQ
jgi:hypothetical protein